ncbi:hypothetical protein R3P38DRAFT_2780797 [Favolaschia claudopus]|uniref:Uncharacterized protein n=1 Tax=Favolaschia claudopus TaxID=2862362 RepID=A0AAW0B6R9_9AGAR
MSPTSATLRRSSSDISHVSDSEPERIAATQRAKSSRKARRQREALASIPNVSSSTNEDVSGRILVLEDTVKQLECELKLMRDEIRGMPAAPRLSVTRRATASPPSTPPPKRFRVHHDACVGNDSPLGRIDSPLIHQSSLRLPTPERDANSRELEESVRSAIYGTKSPKLYISGKENIASPSPTKRKVLTRRCNG